MRKLWEWLIFPHRAYAADENRVIYAHQVYRRSEAAALRALEIQIRLNDAIRARGGHTHER